MKAYNFRFEKETIELLDKLKTKIGYSSRSETIRFLIHSTRTTRKDVSPLDINTLLLSATILLGVGFMTNNPYLKYVSILLLFMVGASALNTSRTQDMTLS